MNNCCYSPRWSKCVWPYYFSFTICWCTTWSRSLPGFCDCSANTVRWICVGSPRYYKMPFIWSINCLMMRNIAIVGQGSKVYRTWGLNQIDLIPPNIYSFILFRILCRFSWNAVRIYIPSWPLFHLEKITTDFIKKNI